MKTNRILPAALAVAVIAAGGASQALAQPNEHFHRGQEMRTETQMASKDMLTLIQAEQKALDKVGGGEILSAARYGVANDMYRIDIKKGDTVKEVFINSKTGTVELAAIPDPTVDPMLMGTDRLHHENHQ